MIPKFDLLDLCTEYHAAECKIRAEAGLTEQEVICYYECQGFRPDCPSYKSYGDYLEERKG
jgi:hypothetical protein